MSADELIHPRNVHEILNRHILTDGYDIVLDLQKSKGMMLHDARSGKEYLDLFTFFASNPLGMNHPALDNAEFRDKLGRVAVNKPSNSDIYTGEMAEFVDNFSRVGIPGYLPHSFFIAGGALAVENALKVAFDWKVQKNFEKGYREERGFKVLHLDQAFHGRSGYTLSLTNTDPRKTRYFPKFDWPRIASPAMEYPETPERAASAEERERRALAQAERHFERNPDQIACIILEPIQGEGGDRHFRPEFHRALRELADRHEALLVHDEVQTGVGLTGRFWAHEHYIKPDILAFGKKAQVCGILAGERIDEVPDNCFKVSSRINSTWGGNLVDMVRFGRILQVIEEEELVQNAEQKGQFLQKGLRELASEHEVLSNPRGKGLMCAVDLPDAATRDAVRRACFERQMMILGCGERTLRFRPPLTVQQEQLTRALEIVEASVKAVKA
ncbi:MAG: L-lysine 6-transaminase [Balneolaceae bacterium]|nr:L-lysine 6-transaminase [Balneolaceae bacterium]